jgi:hypothetical protein
MIPNKEKELSFPPTRLRELFRYDAENGELIWEMRVSNAVRSGTVAGCRHRSGYWVVTMRGVQFLAHRIIWAFMTGAWPKEEIDHMNGIKDDNRWTNLRSCTRSENDQNSFRQCNNRSGYKWVFQRGGRSSWIARVQSNKRIVVKQGFKTKEAAYLAACEIAKELHGEFVNFGGR